MRHYQATFVLAGLLAGILATSETLAQQQRGEQQRQRKQLRQQKAEKVEASKLPACPVGCRGSVDFSHKATTDEGPVYVCGPGCLKKFQADPGKYAEPAAAQRKALAKRPRIQVTCPLSGQPINKRVFTKHDGRTVHFCCNGCKTQFEQDPDKYRGKLAGSYTYQTRCPVMDDEIDPSIHTDLPTGQRIYFCCKGCIKTFHKDLAKYAPNLAKQGIKLDLDEIKARQAAPGEAGRQQPEKP
jgi:YHS domain-containing protein